MVPEKSGPRTSAGVFMTCRFRLKDEKPPTAHTTIRFRPLTLVSTLRQSVGKRNVCVATFGCCVYGRHGRVSGCFDPRPTCSAKNHECDSASRKVLLVPKVGVRGYENLEASKLGSSEQFAVF